MSRRFVTSLAILATGLLSGSALAQARGGWDGMWTGVSEHGRPVVVRIQGRSVTHFSIDSVNVPVSVTGVSAREVEFLTDGDRVRFILERQGASSARWVVRDGRFGKTSAVLHRN
jgi:hypothetical protein